MTTSMKPSTLASQKDTLIRVPALRIAMSQLMSLAMSDQCLTRDPRRVEREFLEEHVPGSC